MDDQIKAVTVLAALENYLKKLQEYSDKDCKENYPQNWANGFSYKYSVKRTKKWYKITHTIGEQTSVFAFIDPITGDIYKPATWSKPATGIRGNIFNDRLPLTSGSLYR